LDAVEEQQEILPYLLQGDYLFDTTPMSESLQRQERRAENQGLFQTIVNSQQIVAASGSPWNMRPAQERLLDAFDIEDKATYFTAVPPAATPGAAGGGQVPAEPTGPGGVTAPQATDAATSPSTQASLSPAVFTSRAQAMAGGVNNGTA
jgi:hypothetical protein